MKKSILFAALCCIAMLFVACEKDKTSEIIDGVTVSGNITGHNYVDLGLPSGTKWATCNMGATKPEESGNYYAWGEITVKDTYDLSTYKYAKFSHGYDLTKYCDTDGRTTLEASDDVVIVNWGTKWRIPTADEWNELILNCTWTWISLNNINGYEVKAANGNFIFLPASGYRYGDELKNAAICVYCWSSSLYMGYNAWCIYFDSTTEINEFSSALSTPRYYGLPIRPVVAE